MGDVVNLRLARKRRDRKAAGEEAARNRAKHGMSKAGKAQARDEAERLARRIDGAKREPEGSGGEER